jgi:hypothetical protein
MNTETEAKLAQFNVQQLRNELLVRGAGMHARSAESMLGANKNLGGDPTLADVSTKDLAAALRIGQKVVYGVDDRKDLFEVSDSSVKANSRSVVSLFLASGIVSNGDGTSTLQTGKFGQLNSLCQQEPYYHQPAGAFCSGFLVAPAIIATAGHCVNEDNVTTVRFVFGFQMSDASTAALRIPDSDIYTGAEVIGRELTNDGTDWCLVRLDREVNDRQILALRSEGKIADNAEVYVLGHPSGLPLKFADGANVRINTHDAVFTANLDTYGGNSGSPVFNRNTHEVEGILVRGATDFVPVGFCMVSAICPINGCQGEDCTRVSEFVSLLDP